MPNWTKEQSLAINESGSNIIVSAGAGSGKTAVLSERVIEKLKQGINIDELLILTFTNAAAAEMKDRIRKKILKHEELKEQLDKLDIAYITTFDSYALALVKKYNYLLNVGKNVSIIDSSLLITKKEEMMDEIFEDLYKEKNSMFEKLISDFCVKDDVEIKEQILQINNQLDMLYDKEVYLNNYIDNYYNADYIDNLIEEYINLLSNKIGILNNDFILLEENATSEYYEKCQNIIENLLISKNYDDVKNNLCSLPRIGKNESETTKEIKEKINKKIKELEKYCEYENEQKIKELILETKDYVKIIIEIINRFDKKIKKYKNEIDCYEFNDIAYMAIKVLKEHEDIRKNIKYSLKEIMIDEYQDTSDLQDIFISEIDNNNVYMVGDIKQSIYRFRNANPNLFKSKYENYSKNNGGIKIDLIKNFRSRKEVLNDINEFFVPIMTNNIGGADYIKSHQMEYGNLSYDKESDSKQSYNSEFLNYIYDKNIPFSKEEIEVFIIANDIKEKVKNNYKVFDMDKQEYRNIKYNDIAILMDKAKQFTLYKKIFEYLNIPISVYKNDVISDSIDIKIVKNIINLLINKKQDQSFKYSFISILRSYLFNLDDDEIFKYFVNNNYSDSELIKIINSIDTNNFDLVETINEIVQKFNMYEKMITIGNIKQHMEVIDSLLNTADSLQSMGYTIKDFYNYLDNITNNPEKYKIEINSKEENEGVKIMTIHASKGLEYHLCYFPGLYTKFNIRELTDKFMYSNKYGFIVPVFDNGIRKTIIKELYKNDYIKEEISERIRLFYVALTRAKEKMIFVTSLDQEDREYQEFVSDDIRLNYKSFLDVLNSIFGVIKKYVKNIELEKLNMTKDYNFIKKINYKEKINKTNDKIEINEINIKNHKIEEKHFSKENNKLLTKEEIENINLGKKFHSLLENIDFNNIDYEKLNSFEKENIKKFIDTNILKNALNIYKEYEFVYVEDDVRYHGIIDLLIEYENEYKIIDYKLKNINDNAYISQLQGYKKYIEAITDKKVEIYLYSILNGNLEKI